MNTGRFDGLLLAGPRPEEKEIRERAADQAEDIKVSSMSKGDPDVTHESRWRGIVAAADEADQRIALEVLVIKNPFLMMDVLKDHMSRMYSDLKDLREIFTDKEDRENEVCGGEE